MPKMDSAYHGGNHISGGESFRTMAVILASFENLKRGWETKKSKKIGLSVREGESIKEYVISGVEKMSRMC